MKLSETAIISYTEAINGLTLSQAKSALSTTALNDIQKEQILISAGLVKNTEAVALEEVKQMASSMSLSAQKKEEILATLQGAYAENEWNIERLEAIVSAGGEAGAIAETILAKKAENAENIKNIAGKKALTVSLKEELAARLALIASNPAVWIAGIIAVSVGLIALQEKFNKSLKECNEELEEYNSEFENSQSKVESLETELSNCNERLSELQELSNNGTISIIEQEEYERLKKTNDELERSINIEKEKSKISAIDAAKSADETLSKRVTSNYIRGNVESDMGVVLEDQILSVTTYEELNAAIDEYNKLQKQIDELKVSYDNGNISVNEYENQLEELTNKQTESRTRASEMNDVLTDCKQAYDNLDQTGTSLSVTQQDNYKIVDEATQKYNNFLNVINGVNESFDNLDKIEKAQKIKDKYARKKVSLPNNRGDYFINDDNISNWIDTLSDDDLDILASINFSGEQTKESMEDALEYAKTHTESNIEVEIEFPTISKTISDLEDLNKELDKLGSAMANIDAEGKFDLGDLDSIADYFLGLEDVPYDIEAVNDALKSLGDGNASLEEQADSINTLADQYLKTSGILDTLNSENAELIKLQLQRMGIVNAEEIVEATLNRTLQDQAQLENILAQYKSVVTGETLTLANVTAQEIQNLITEGKITNDTANQMAILAIKKQLVNGNTLNTSADINNLISLCQMLGATTTALEKYNQVKNGANGMPQYVIDKYKEAAERELKNAINTGEKALKATYTQVPKAIYNGGANVQKALDDANKSASSSAKETEDTYEELFDFFERRIEVLNDALDLLKSNLENVVGADAKNTLIDAQIGINKESINNYTDALAMYMQKANEALAKIPAEFQSKIVDGSVSMTDFIGSGNKDLVEAINEYKDWAGKISDCKKELADLKQALEDLELEKFNNIVDDFTNQFDIRDNSKDLIDKQIGLFEEAGQMIGRGFYQGLINESEGQLSILQQEKAKLVAQMNSALDSGNVKAGSEAWLSMVDSLSEVDSKILDCKKDIEEFNNSIQELHWEVVERIQKNFDGISDEIKNIIGLIDEVDVSDAEGIWSKEGLTQLGLYAQEFEKAIYAANMYGQEIEQLNQAYIRGEYSATEYQDKLIELKNAQWDEINASESAKDAIMDLNKARIDIMIKAIEEEIDAMKELIDSKKEALDAEQELYEYKKSISEKTKSITDLEKQIAAMQNDTTASSVAKRKKLEEELTKAKQDLADYEYSHSIDVQKDALDQQYEDFETEKNAEIEKLEATLDDMEAVISASFEIVKEKALVIGTEINDIAQAHGVSITNEITSAWSKGADAIGYYGETLNAGASSFVSNLTTMKDSVYYLQNQADITSSSLANMYNTNSQALLNNLTNAYYSLANTNAVTQALGQSLINTLSRGYDTNSLVNSIKNVGDSAANAAKQVSSLMNALAGQPTNDISISGHSKGGSKSSNDVIKGAGYFATNSNSDDWIKVKKYAKGGIITKEDAGFLDPLAKSVGEDHMVAAKEGEGFLTQVQTSEFMKLIPNMENFNRIIPNLIPEVNTMINPNAVKSNSPTVQIHYDNLVQVQGDVNNSNIRQMEQIVDNAITKQFNIFNTQLRKAGVR